MRLRLLAMRLLALVVTLIGCALPVRADGDGTLVRDALQELLETAPPQVQAFYRERDLAPAWTGDDRAAGLAGEARDAVAHADTHGLEPDDYMGWKKWDGRD